MKYLLKIAKAVAQGQSRDEARSAVQAQRASVSEELTGLTDEDISLLAETLFGAEPKTGRIFYDELASFQHRIGYEALHHAVVGKMWARAFDGLPEDKGLELLSVLPSDDRRGFWAAIRCLPAFCAVVELPPAFGAKWFHDLGMRVEGDLAGGDFFDAVCGYAETFPESAFAIFEHYVSQDLDPLTVHLAGLLLGTARAKSILGEMDTSSVQKWDRKLQRSTVVQERLTYHKSLVGSFNLGTLSISQLKGKLARMLAGTPEEVSEAFDVIGRCLRKDRSNTKFIRFAMEWYGRNSSPELPAFAKFYLVKSLWLFCSSHDIADRDVVMSRANDLLVAIQPIPREQHGTWQELERYLVSMLEFNRREFECVFDRLVKSNPAGVLEQIKESDLLRSELTRANSEELVTRLLLSADTDEWQIGKSLLADGAAESLSEEVLAQAGETRLELALLQFVRSPLLAEGTSKYLSQLEPYFQNASSELQQHFKNELVVQAMNYPGACLSTWKKRNIQSPLMSEAIERAEKYFEDRSRLHDSPAVSFSFPGCEAAQRKADQIFRSKVMREAEEKSVFAKFARHFQVVYGERWATFIDGRLDGPSTFSEHSHSMEFPRLEVIDPEGMAIRRLNASSRIEELKAKVAP